MPGSGDSKTVPANTPVDLTPYPGLLTNLTATDYHNGYTISGNVTVEHEFAHDIVLQVGYVFNNAVSLYASQYPNGYVGADPSIAIYTAINPSLSEFQLTDNHGHSTYNSLQTVFRKSVPSAGLTFQLSYTYSKAIDNASTVYNGDSANSAFVPNDPTCWSCDKARASFDVPHRVVANFSYSVPFDKLGPSLAEATYPRMDALGNRHRQFRFPVHCQDSVRQQALWHRQLRRRNGASGSSLESDSEGRGPRAGRAVLLERSYTGQRTADSGCVKQPEFHRASSSLSLSTH